MSDDRQLFPALNHSNGVIFICENNMLSSRVKISRFRTKAHLVFHCCLYNKLLYLSVSKCGVIGQFCRLYFTVRPAKFELKVSFPARPINLK